MSNDFWTFNLGHITIMVAVGGLALSILKVHRENMIRAEHDAKGIQEMRTKLDLIYDWFTSNIVKRSRRGGDQL